MLFLRRFTPLRFLRIIFKMLLSHMGRFDNVFTFLPFFRLPRVAAASPFRFKNVIAFTPVFSRLLNVLFFFRYNAGPSLMSFLAIIRVADSILMRITWLLFFPNITFLCSTHRIWRNSFSIYCGSYSSLLVIVIPLSSIKPRLPFFFSSPVSVSSHTKPKLWA